MPFFLYTYYKQNKDTDTKCFDSEVNKLLLSKNEGSETGSM